MSLAVSTPTALLLLLSILALAWLSVLTLRWQGRTHARLAGGSGLLLLHGAASSRRRAVKVTLLLIALAVLVVGAAGPYVGQPPEALQPQRTDTMVVLDVSLSMLVQDVKPSRFEVGRRSVENLLNAMQSDCIGLIVFGGRAALRTPCTLDYAAVRSILRSTAADSAPLPGSSLAEGLRTGLAALRHSDASRKGILLISDGEDLGGGIESALADLKTAGIAVHALGTGTAQGASIPLPVEDGRASLKQDKSGQVVISQLDEPMLQKIASETGGAYLSASAAGQELLRLHQALRAPTLATVAEPIELPAATLTTWLGLAALLLLVIEILIAERSIGQARRRLVPQSTAVLAVMVIAIGCTSAVAEVYTLNRAGLEAYDNGRFEGALNAFRQAQTVRPDLPELSFNAGTALYEGTYHERSLFEWQRAAETLDETLKRNTDFNLGNALFRLERYEEAAEAYKRVLRASSADLDAKINLELTLQKLKSQQPEQQRFLPPGTPREIPLGDADPGPQGNQPQPPLRPSDGQQGPDPRESPFPPQGGPGLPEYQPDPQDGQQPQQQESPQPQPLNPVEELRRVIEEAGQEFSEEEALRILAALRLREPSLQERYNNPPGNTRQARPDRDW